LRITIGGPNLFVVSGAQTYIINYCVYNAIRTFSDHDELYWNAAGDQWQVAIRSANVSLTLPEQSIPNLKMVCFTAPRAAPRKITPLAKRVLLLTIPQRNCSWLIDYEKQKPNFQPQKTKEILPF